jgi:hypothetical protein
MTSSVPETARFELAMVRLARLRSRHHRIEDPSIFGNSAGICESDRHRWPCHATTLLGTLDKVLALTRNIDGGDLPPDYPVTVADIRAALAAGLLAEEHNNA